VIGRRGVLGKARAGARTKEETREQPQLRHSRHRDLHV
jgi:hypothetical protein